MEHRRWSYRTHRIVALRVIAVLFALVCTAAVGKVTLDVFHWRT